MASEIHEEIIVTLENRPGALADVLDIVAKDGVNVLAVCAYALGRDAGAAHILPDHPVQAKAALDEAGVVYKLSPAVVALVADEPGAAAAVARRVAARGVNIEHCYATGIGSGEARVVLRAADNGAAKEAIDA